MGYSAYLDISSPSHGVRGREGEGRGHEYIETVGAES